MTDKELTAWGELELKLRAAAREHILRTTSDALQAGIDARDRQRKACLSNAEVARALQLARVLP